MTILLSAIEVFVFAITLVLAGMIGYLLLLTASAWLTPRRTPPRIGEPSTRFVVLIPAHNEEQLLPQLLEHLNQLDYPKQLYEVHVVADNCSDGTAACARAHGATAHEREDKVQAGKGYALTWLIQRIWASEKPFDAAVFFDADSVVSPNFLRVMDARLSRREQVIQASYIVRDPHLSWGVGIRAAAMIALNFLRPHGRMGLGGSAGLKGNGMVMSNRILKQYLWTNSQTEDIEYHMHLILGGERVTFAADAFTWAEMPTTLAASRTQNVRWEYGRMEMVRRYVPLLLREAVRRRSFMLFDAAIDQLIPPFSIVAALNVFCLVAALVLRHPALIAFATAVLVGQLVYILSGLILAKAPWKVYQALLYTPLFIIWKGILYIQLLLGLKPKNWVRTARNDG